MIPGAENEFTEALEDINPDIAELLISSMASRAFYPYPANELRKPIRKSKIFPLALFLMSKLFEIYLDHRSIE